MGKEFFYYAPRALYRTFFPLNDRNPEMVKSAYDKRYQAMLEHFKAEQPTLEEYMFGRFISKEPMLVHDKIVYGTPADSYRAFLPYLEQYLVKYLTPGAVVIEYGCGNGRNLFYLKLKYPQVRYIGYELSTSGVELARTAAVHYNLPVEFIEANLTAVSDMQQKATIAYSCFSLEQMPRTFMRTVKHMARASGGSVVLFEPVPELYPWNLRGITSRARAVVIDHVRHIIPALRREDFTIDEAKRLGVGNPLTEACVIVAHTSPV